MRIMIGVPSYGPVEPECVEALMNMSRCGHDVGFRVQRGYLIDAERNAIVRTAIEDGYDYVLMVDSDTVLPFDAIANLLDPCADIVLGVVRLKGPADNGNYLNVYKHTPAGYGIDASVTTEEADAWVPNRVTVKGGGAACMMLRCAALERLPEPWFEYVDYGNGEQLSEDLYFCEKARTSGLTIWADKRVRCGHVVRRLLWP